MRRDGKKKNRKAWIHFRTGLVVGKTWSLLLCMKSLAEQERMWRDGRAERRKVKQIPAAVFFNFFMQSYYRLIWIINWAVRGTWSHITHAKNAELLWRQNKTIQGEAGGSNMGLSPWMRNNGTKKTRYKAAPTVKPQYDLWKLGQSVFCPKHRRREQSGKRGAES